MISILKLTSGEEIVGTITKQDMSYITVNEPLMITYIQRSLGAPSVTLQRYIPFTTQPELTFMQSHVQVICKPIEGMEEYYTNALRLIKKHIDPSLVSDLTNSNSDKGKPLHDEYLALLEKYMSKKPLN